MELNKVYNMNCIDGLKELDNNSVDVSFTSPPYNRKRNDKYTFYDDTLTDYYGFLCGFTDELIRITRRHVFVNIQKNYYNKNDVFRYIGKYSDKIVEIIIWEKSNPMPASGCNITNSYEYIIVLGNEPLKANHTYTKNIFTTSVNPQTFKIHKAVMNKAVSDYIIEMFTKEGDLILDPFFGLGTTALSCIDLGRRWIGFEMNKEYCDVANDRINEVIGKKEV